jgi:hypothetical protein
LELLVASVVSVVVAGGTFMAFVAAARMRGEESNPATAEAAAYAQQTVERFRNRVACQGSPWFDPACNPTLPAGWQSDPFVGGGGTESILTGPARRCYQVQPFDCDGDGTDGDCLQMDVTVCWGDLTGCAVC